MKNYQNEEVKKVWKLDWKNLIEKNSKFHSYCSLIYQDNFFSLFEIWENFSRFAIKFSLSKIVYEKKYFHVCDEVQYEIFKLKIL